MTPTKHFAYFLNSATDGFAAGGAPCTCREGSCRSQMGAVLDPIPDDGMNSAFALKRPFTDT